MAEAKEKRVRAKRRNFEKELAGLKLYCEVNIELLKDLKKDIESRFTADGQIVAFERVLAKINGGQS